MRRTASRSWVLSALRAAGGVLRISLARLSTPVAFGRGLDHPGSTVRRMGLAPYESLPFGFVDEHGRARGNVVEIAAGMAFR